MSKTGKFVSFRLKIKRAYRHIQEFDSILSPYLKSDFWTLTVEPNSEHPGREAIMFRVLRAPPIEDLAIIIGDVVHNTSSAIDHAMVEIFPDQAEWLSYPSRKKRDDIERSKTYGFIKKSLPKLAKIILDEISSYDTGQPSIWAARALDNTNEHRLLIPVVSFSKIEDVTAFGGENGSVVLDNISFAITGSGVVGAALPTPVKIHKYGQATASILFGNGQPLEGQPVIESLTTMVELASQAIETLETFWFGKGKKA